MMRLVLANNLRATADENRAGRAREDIAEKAAESSTGFVAPESKRGRLIRKPGREERRRELRKRTRIYSATDETRTKHRWGKDFAQEGTERTEEGLTTETRRHRENGRERGAEIGRKRTQRTQRGRIQPRMDKEGHGYRKPLNRREQRAGLDVSATVSWRI